MTRPTRKKLIEVSIPLEAINAESSKRKQKAPKGYPTAIHKYWAQRPVAACRAVLFAQLVDDPSAWPERFTDQAAQDLERRRLHNVMERLLPWEASNDDGILLEAKWEIARSIAWGLGEEPPSKENPRAVQDYIAATAPALYDPFSGGASIPLEAQRLGLRVVGSDLNPLAVAIGKGLVEIPSTFSNAPPVNPKSQEDLKGSGCWNGKGAQGLADDVRYYGRWIRARAEEQIGSLYPPAVMPDGSEGSVVAWLWVRTVRSPDPRANGAVVPLASTFVLSNKAGKKVWVEVILDDRSESGWHFEVRSGSLAGADEQRFRNGTKVGRGSNFVCILTGAPIDADWIKSEGKAGRLGTRLMAMVVEANGTRSYISPTTEHQDIAVTAKANWLPQGEIPIDPRHFSTNQFGLDTFHSIFTSRQLVSLTTFCDLAVRARDQVLLDAKAVGMFEDPRRFDEGGSGAEAYADAVATYLAFVIDRMAFYGSSLCGWLAKDNAMGKSMPLQGLAMSWDFAEGNPFGKSSSDALTCTKAIADCISELQQTTKAVISQADACQVDYEPGCLISTDPPYYDNFGYADLSDFFYPWLKATLGTAYRQLFRRLSTPKDAELVANPYRHGGNEASEAFFMQGMGRALWRMKTAKTLYPIVIYYAFKQQEQSQDGITSAGWAGFLQAIVDSGFAIDGTWPIRTENPSRSIAQGTNALASSIVLVCRERSVDCPVISRADFLRALKQEMPDAIDAIRRAGVGPVDMQQSVLGPGMEIFSRNARVLEDDDSPMIVRTALALINRVWQEIENELDTAFDPETQVALTWYDSYGFEARSSGELIMLTTAKNTSDRALFHSGVFQDRKGKTALTPRAALSADWSPANDSRLTVWECVQHVARTLVAEDGGTEAAARLIVEMGSKSTDARKLAYRLFEIATKKNWSAEALVYNELAEVWPRLEDLATQIASRAPTPAIGSPQADLFGMEV